MTIFWAIFISGIAGIVVGYLAGHHDGVERGVTSTIGCMALGAAKAERIAEFKEITRAVNGMSKSEVKAASEMAMEVYRDDDADSAD